MSICADIFRHSTVLSGLVVGTLVIGSGSAWAAPVPDGLPAWQCSGQGSHLVMATEELGNFGQQPGYLTEYPFSGGATADAVCNCPGSVDEFSLFTAVASLPEADGWMRLNENISARLYIFVYGPGEIEVPFYQRQNRGRTPCSSSSNSFGGIATGNRGKVEFRVEKGILGESHFDGELAVLYWQFESATGAPDYNFPFVRINADFTITSTAECSFRAGDTFTVDLGSTPMNQLNVGAPPGAGYIPRQIDLTVDCTNISDSAISGLEFFANATGAPNADGPFIATDRPGIGVGMTDANGNQMALGMDNSVIQPYSNGSSQAYLRFYPTIIPGKESEVTPGPYSTTMTVTVTIP